MSFFQELLPPPSLLEWLNRGSNTLILTPSSTGPLVTRRIISGTNSYLGTSHRIRKYN